MRDVAGGGYDGKEAPNFLLKEELEKNNSEWLIRAKLLGSCFTAAVYFIVFLRYIIIVGPCTRVYIEIDMSVFEAPL